MLRTSAFRFGLVLACLCAQPAWSQAVVATLPVTATPKLVTVNPASNRWYVTGTGNQVDIYDGATLQRTTLTGTADTLAMAVDPSRNLVLMSHTGADFLTQIDGNNSLTTLALFGRQPSELILDTRFGSLWASVRSPANKLIEISGLGQGSYGIGAYSTVACPGALAMDASDEYSFAQRFVYTADGCGAPTVYKSDYLGNTATISIAPHGNARAIAVNPLTKRWYVTTDTSVVEIDPSNTVTFITAVSNAKAVAVNPVTDKIYVTAAGSNQVKVIDGPTRAVDATVAVGTFPTALAIDAVTNKVYVANEMSGTVSVIDAANAVSTITVGNGPKSLALSPVSGRVLVLNAGDNTISVIDRDAWTVGPDGPISHRVALNPMTNRAYVATYFGGSQLHVVDAGTGAVLASPNVGISVYAVAVDPGINRIFAMKDTGETVIVNGADNTIAGSFSTGINGRSIAVNPVTHKVYVANLASHNVTIADGVTGSVLATVPTGNSAEAVAVNAQTNRVFVANSGSNTVSVIDGTTNTLVKNIGVGSHPVSVAVNQATNRIYVGNQNGSSVSEIDGATIDDPGPTVLTRALTIHPTAIAVNPVTGRVYVAGFGGTELNIIDAGGTVTQLEVGAPDGVAVDPVRNRIFVTRNAAGTVAIIDGASLAIRNVTVGASPQPPTADPVNGKLFVPHFNGPLKILDPGQPTYAKRTGSITFGGAYTRTSNPAGEFVVHFGGEGWGGVDYFPLQMRYRVGDSQGAHSAGTPYAIPDEYKGNVSGITKGLNYLSGYAVEHTTGTTMSNESGDIGAFSSVTGVPFVAPFLYVDPPLITLDATLPGGTAGQPYLQAVTTVPGVGGLLYYLDSGTMPPGVGVDGAGAIIGTPTGNGGDFTFTVLAVDSTGGTGQRTFSLHIAPDYEISVAPPALGFGNRGIGTTSAASTVTVTAAGASDLTVGTVTITGTNAADFAIASNTCATVLSGQSCDIGVTFTPSATGARSAILNIPSNDPDEANTQVALSGSGDDTVPDAFSFVDQANVPRSALRTSALVAITGITVPAPISVIGGEYSIAAAGAVTCAPSFTTAAGTIANGEQVCVRHTSSALNSAATDTVLTIGGVPDTFTSTTLAAFTVTVTNGGNGTVSGTGIACPGDCTETVDAGTVLALTVTPNVNFAASVTGTCGGTLAGTTYTTSAIAANCTVAATFQQLVTYALTVAKTGAGTGTVTGTTDAGTVVNCGSDCSEDIPPGKSVTLTAAATGGSTFRSWEGACSSFGTGTCTLTMDAAKSIAARFDPASTAASADMTSTHTGPSTGATGRDLVFTVAAVNNGPATATNVQLRYFMPSGADYVWSSPGCANQSGTVVCTVASLAASASAPFKVVIRPTAAGTLDSAAAGLASESDPNSANNVSSVSVNVTTSPAGIPIQRYRLYSDVTKEHHFTTDLNEYNVLGTYVGTWVQEGTVGKILNNPGPFGGVESIPYYRLYDNSTRWHHWTTDANEYYTLGYIYSGWNMEGVDGWILPSNAPGTTQLYRLNYPALGALHHWTIDANEYNTLITSFGWVGEPGAGFVVQ